MSAFLLRFKANYLENMNGYPYFSLWIPKALAKIYFFRVVLTWRKNLCIQFYKLKHIVVRITTFVTNLTCLAKKYSVASWTKLRQRVGQSRLEFYFLQQIPIIRVELCRLATLYFSARQVGHKAVIRATDGFNLHYNNVARQVSEKCFPYCRIFRAAERAAKLFLKIQ